MRAQGIHQTQTPHLRLPHLPLHHPLESSARDLTLKLWAEETTATITPGLLTNVYSFGAEVLDGDPASITPSGSYLGPTLHVRKGQRLKATFENRLPEESIAHWHGLIIPQDQDGQPGDAVPAGGTYEYDFIIENEPGTYWYHPHPHEKTGQQVYRGLAGLLIIHGDEAALPSGENDVAIVLQDRNIDSEGQLHYIASMHDQMAGFVGSTIATDGNLLPEAVTVKAGDVELWEFVSRSPIPHPMHVHGRALRVINRTWDDDSSAAS